MVHHLLIRSKSADHPGGAPPACAGRIVVKTKKKRPERAEWPRRTLLGSRSFRLRLFRFASPAPWIAEKSEHSMYFESGVAERVGFEPTIPLLAGYCFSRAGPSATRPPLHFLFNARKVACLHGPVNRNVPTPISPHPCPSMGKKTCRRQPAAGTRGHGSTRTIASEVEKCREMDPWPVDGCKTASRSSFPLNKASLFVMKLTAFQTRMQTPLHRAGTCSDDVQCPTTGLARCLFQQRQTAREGPGKGE
jgi:hypothetical protein